MDPFSVMGPRRDRWHGDEASGQHAPADRSRSPACVRRLRSGSGNRRADSSRGAGKADLHASHYRRALSRCSKGYSPARRGSRCSRAAIEADFVGTHSGEFGGLAATGRAVRVPYSVVYDLRGDRISALRIYFPMSLLMEQISG
jgi:SnoaL-like polyketide cyclase